MTAEIAKTVHLSYTAPSLPTPHIQRPDIISAISQLFDSSITTVCVESRQGYGKTTLLREFAEQCTCPCFSLFLREGSRHAYDPVLARADLTNQLYWHLEGKRLPDEIELADAEFQRLLRRCTRNLSRHNSIAYFVIDGLHNIPEEDAPILQAIMSFLPFGARPFRFLFSTDSSKDIFQFHKNLNAKPFVLMAFNSHETNEFLSDVIDQKSVRLEHHRVLGGVPSLLASTRRQLMSRTNADVSKTLSLPPEIDAFLEAEWQLLSPLSANKKTVLSYLVAYGRPISTSQLCLYANLHADEIEKTLCSFPFVSTSIHSGGWEFTSEPFRRYVARKLRNSIKEATEEIATRLLKDPDSDEALHLLPQYLQRTADTNKILEWFDECRFAKILLKNRSPAWTEPVLRNAIKLAHNSRNDRALTTYSVLRSIVPQITNITGIENEIRARCALGDFDAAHSIANSARLLTQKLRLLAVLVDAGSSQPGVIVQPIRDEIRDLVRQLDLDYIQKDEAIDIVVDLYPVDQELALQVLKGTIKDEKDNGSFDIALARITVAALRSQHSSEDEAALDNSSPKSTDELVDERIQKFFTVTQRSLRAKSAAEVLDLTEEIDQVSEKLFILRKWINLHRTRNDILELVEKAINDAIGATDFIPTATFYREVLAPLPFSSATPERRRIIAIVDAQRPVIKAKGPTVDDICVQLTLAACNCQQCEWQRAANRLEELYLESIEPIDDLETRTTCLAMCIANLAKFDSKNTLDSHTQFRSLVEKEFNKATSEVLKNYANQYIILNKAIESLSLFEPKRALELCNCLNTKSSRTQSVLKFVSVLCDESQETFDFEILFESLAFIDTGPEFDKAITLIGSALVKDIECGDHNIAHARKWLSMLERCASTANRCESLARVAAAFAKVNGDETIRNNIAEQLRSDFARLKNPGNRYSVGCKLVFLLNESCPKLAKDIFAMFSKDGRVSRLAENVEQGSYCIVDLLAKSSCALARAKLLTDGDIQRVCNLISQITDIFWRVRLYTRLAFFFWREGEQEHFSTIVNSRIWPELVDLNGSDKELLYNAWVNAYGVIWLEDRDRAREAIAQFPQRVRYPSVRNLCLALLYKLPVGEPFDGRGKPTLAPLSYTNISNLLYLCKELEEDHAIYLVFEGIANLVSNGNSTCQLTRDQKAEISRLMHEVAETQLPSSHGVKHYGYRIVCKAQALRLIRASKEQWLELISERDRIENFSDRVLVSTLLAFCLPNKMRKERKELFSSAEAETKKLKTIEDRFQRYESLAVKSMDSDRSMAVRVTEKAFQTVAVLNNGRSADRERRLVDLAFRLDPELPMRLAVLFDDDPAREQYRERAKEQINRQELKRALADDKQNIELRERRNDPNLAVAAWQSLAGLNAGRILAVDMSRAREMLACASNYPLETAYPMYSWVLSNVMEKYARTEQASQYIRDLFEGLARGSNFFFMIAGSNDNLDFNPKWQNRNEEDFHIVLIPGEREKALRFLRKWVESNTEEFVTIIDPYFGPEELWVVRLLMECNSSLDIRIVAGRTAAPDSSNGRVAETYRTAWGTLCDQNPPRTEILSVSFVENGKCPIHDRWILSKSAGVRLGTSINSIGNSLSEISAMDSNELERVQQNVNRYWERRIREEEGKRVTYELFELLP